MIRFPDRRYGSAAEYLNEYATHVASAIESVSRDALDRAASLLTAALERDATIFACGNGGSAAIANHLSCDHQKGIHNGTNYRPRVVCLSSNMSLITAVANDIGYTESFSFPLSLHGRSGDLLITISSSGNSENIVRALQVAESLGMRRITFTGFDGGRSRKMADANIHVGAHNYGVVEDVHQACMHILAQYVRHAAMRDESIRGSVF
jgi:D-sedoheptulose 7-phosphate isomerase/D-glycero-D-manno-heptose 1,7-bisphosphate phosphatase